MLETKHHDVKQRYQETHSEFTQLLDFAFRLSIASQGKAVNSRNLEVASWVFAKLLLHAKAALDLAPKEPLGDLSQQNEFWDISSMATLVRSEIDAYYTLFYIAIDDVEEEMRVFRWLLWDYHSEFRRLQKLELIKSTSNGLSNLKETIAELKKKITNHPVYLRQNTSTKNKIAKGDLPRFATNTDISICAGIDPAYHKVVFMFLSSYVHAYPFSMNQLAVFRAGETESLRLVSTVLQYASVYLALSIRDFLQLMPNQELAIPNDVEEIIKIWSGIAQDFSSRLSDKDDNPS